MNMCTTLGLPLGVCLLAVVAGGAGSLCCGTNMVIVVSTTLPVTIYYFVLYLLMAHLGYLHLPRASLRCCNSSFRSSGEVCTTLTLWVSVHMTL